MEEQGLAFEFHVQSVLSRIAGRRHAAGRLCMAARLRVYPSPEESAFPEAPAPSVSVSLGELLPLVALARRHNYLWLQDFLDDEVCVTSDLYEVLQAFRAYRPSA